MSRQRVYRLFSGNEPVFGPLRPRKIAYGVIVRRERVIICKWQGSNFREQGTGNREQELVQGQGSGIRRAFEAVGLFHDRCAVGRVRDVRAFARRDL